VWFERWLRVDFLACELQPQDDQWALCTKQFVQNHLR
jgi:hypothetical protein